MVTSKLVSNIYYGTSEYLSDCLDRLVQGGSLAWYVYISHRGELQYNPLKDRWQGEREKDHIHCAIKPNKRLNLDTVYAECAQLLNGRITGFTRNWQFERSPMDMWLYFQHAPDYLQSRGLVREFNYKSSDLVCSDPDIKDFELRSAWEKFWSQTGVGNEVQKVLSGKMLETELFSRHLRDAWGVDRLYRAALKEKSIKERLTNEAQSIRQISFA